MATKRKYRRGKDPARGGAVPEPAAPSANGPKTRKHVEPAEDVCRANPAANDFYARLGVPGSATTVQIKKAWKLASRHFHPDRNGGVATANDAQRTLNEAYACLSDPVRRAEYDRAVDEAARRAREHDEREAAEARAAAESHAAAEAARRADPWGWNAAIEAVRRKRKRASDDERDHDDARRQTAKLKEAANNLAAHSAVDGKWGASLGWLLAGVALEVMAPSRRF